MTDHVLETSMETGRNICKPATARWKTLGSQRWRRTQQKQSYTVGRRICGHELTKTSPKPFEANRHAKICDGRNNRNRIGSEGSAPTFAGGPQSPLPERGTRHPAIRNLGA